ncbi:hypothetical protein D6779_01840 [Candidatus Parcubacteria bacterium]|nr:MAG: hypothetical protein D6779_01840 [Candidatus Parcubacteria bacterium]
MEVETTSATSVSNIAVWVAPVVVPGLQACNNSTVSRIIIRFIYVLLQSLSVHFFIDTVVFLAKEHHYSFPIAQKIHHTHTTSHH